jgi:hypothetical protein
MGRTLLPVRSRAPLAVAAALAVVAHAGLLQPLAMQAARAPAVAASSPPAMRLVPARSLGEPADPASSGRVDPTSSQAWAAAPRPAPVPAADPAALAFANPASLDGPVLPRSAPALQRLQGLRFSGLPIRLRLFIDAQGQVARVRVLAAQEDDETLAAVTGMFAATAFAPGRRGGRPVACFTDVELLLGTPEG